MITRASTEEETLLAGEKIARQLGSDDLVHVSGDLGAGKTTLIRAIAGALGARRDEVASPTFAIVHEYPTESGPPIVHLDCYRIGDSPREWEEIGIPEILQGPGVKLIEWPKAGFDRYAPATAMIEILVLHDDSREIRFFRP